jgi:hypothetical protein
MRCGTVPQTAQGYAPKAAWQTLLDRCSPIARRLPPTFAAPANFFQAVIAEGRWAQCMLLPIGSPTGRADDGKSQRLRSTSVRRLRAAPTEPPSLPGRCDRCGLLRPARFSPESTSYLSLAETPRPVWGGQSHISHDAGQVHGRGWCISSLDRVTLRLPFAGRIGLRVVKLSRWRERAPLLNFFGGVAAFRRGNRLELIRRRWLRSVAGCACRANSRK